MPQPRHPHLVVDMGRRIVQRLKIGLWIGSLDPFPLCSLIDHWTKAALCGKARGAKAQLALIKPLFQPKRSLQRERYLFVLVLRQRAGRLKGP